MAVPREADVLSLAKRGFEGIGGALLYGTDEEAIADTAREIQRGWDAAEVTVFDAASFRSQQGKLQDMLSAQSLFGARRLIVVQGAEDQHSSVLSLVVGAAHANAYLLVAGSLRKNSALRAAAETSRACVVLALHKESEAAQLIRIPRSGAALGLSFEPGAAERLLELCGGNRSLISSELEKLSLFQPESGKVKQSTVEECCGELGEADFNALFKMMLEGDVPGSDKSIALALEASELSAALPMLQSYLARLATVRAAVEGGISWDVAFQKAAPPIYFGQQAQVKKQLSGLTLESLLRLQAHIQQIVFQARNSGGVGDMVAARNLLAQVARLSGQRLDNSN